MPHSVSPYYGCGCGNLVAWRTEPWSEKRRFTGSWLEPHRRRFELTFLLALHRNELQWGVRVPCEMVWLILSHFQGYNFVAVSQAAVGVE
eukprot:m.31989 g.31989  ORF g.31989 m.31989 type:complete len:90 (+) comp4848_c0_seq1:668-937(+)